MQSIQEKNNYVKNYITKEDWKVKENANMQYSLQGLRNYIATEETKKYWLETIYPEIISKNHLQGIFHIHDLGELSSYCCGWDLQDLLRRGFTGVSGKISCKPAKHFSSVLGQINNFIFTLQGESAGAQAFSNFDTLLAPFIYYDKLNYQQVKQEIQSFVFNLNIPTRVGFQTPFFNITMDMDVPESFKNQGVLIGGEIQSKTYGEFQQEMDLLNQAFAEVMLEGDGHERIFTFPIPTYNITKTFNWDDSRFEKIWEMASKYGIPYFTNYVNSDMNPEDARSMCCRLRLDNRELKKRGGGLFGSNPLTGSIGVVTVNLPRLAILSNLEYGLAESEKKNKFFQLLKEVMDLAKESLEIKRTVLEDFTEAGLYPYTKFYLSDVKKRFNNYWSNHFSTIGLVGMSEVCLQLLSQDITSDDSQKLAYEILEFMREQIEKYQLDTGHLYNLEATPAEGTSYRLARLDKKDFGDHAIFANQTEVLKGVEPYYTNSSQLPVGYTTDIFEALDLQDNLQTRYTGGTVLHGFLGERLDSPESARNIIKKVFQNYHLPYFTITPTFSICSEHGYIQGEHTDCPICRQKTEIYSRVVGYLRPVEQWNLGKQAEFVDRKEFQLRV